MLARAQRRGDPEDAFVEKDPDDHQEVGSGKRETAQRGTSFEKEMTDANVCVVDGVPR